MPKTNRKVPAVLGFGGSDPSWGFADANGAMMASKGIEVLGLVYFQAAPILPPSLDQIPIEYLQVGLGYLETIPNIDKEHFGVVSGSHGSEAAFILASYDRRVRSVVVTTPSLVAWYGMSKASSAWTIEGRDVPALKMPTIEGGSQLQKFEFALSNPTELEKARFAFERINGPILLISAENDQVWPSTRMSKEIVDYLKQKNFPFAVTHRSYPTGHGFDRESAPEIKAHIVAHFIETLR
ncbi:MAG: hypothetical protein E6Q34_05490 [Burkholderiaceae bacterium]|nr:MAG: hypothetical protein E6Q34_05490 [Burkholderiaceae bacterium]